MRLLLSIVSFALGLCLSIELLRALPDPKISESAGALEHLLAHGDEYDLLVVGSSTVRMHYVASLFDQEMKKRGYRIRSFGYSRSALQGGEIDYYLEQILALPMKRLKYVVVDVSLKQLRDIEGGNRYKRRVIEWHAPRQYLHVQSFLIKRYGLWGGLGRIRLSAAHALLRYANVGIGIESLRNGTLLHEHGPIKVKERNAFHPNAAMGKRQLGLMERYRKRSGKAHVRATAKLAKQRKKKLTKPLSNEYAALFRDQIEARGLKAMFLLAPRLTDVRVDPHVKGKPDLRFFDFDQPDKYPELYDVNVRYDNIHLAWPGAQLFTKAFAARFADYLAAEGDTRALIPSTEAQDEPTGDAEDDGSAAVDAGEDELEIDQAVEDAP